MPIRCVIGIDVRGENMIVFSLIFACNPNQQDLPSYTNYDSDSSPQQDEPIDTLDEQEKETAEPQQDSDEICDGMSVGTSLGMCAEDFQQLDKNNNEINLHDFYGDVVFLDLSAPG